MSGSVAVVHADEEHVLYCWDVLVAHYFGQPPPPSPFSTSIACPLFVTWKKELGRSGQLQLRGCIGCLKPLFLSSLREYTLTSALQDRRFPPIDHSELPHLHCAVELLGGFESCGLYDWTIGVHGLTISFVDHAANGAVRSAVYLPYVIPEQRWTQLEAIDSLITKSGCVQPITDGLRASLQVTRFVSTKHTMTYGQWAALRSQANTTRASPTAPPSGYYPGPPHAPPRPPAPVPAAAAPPPPPPPPFG